MTNESVKVTQADRDAAADYYQHHAPMQWGANRRVGMRGGKYDDQPLVQAFARHRTAAQPERDAVEHVPNRIRVEVANALASADCDGPHPEDYWDYLAQAAINKLAALTTPAPAADASDILNDICNQSAEALKPLGDSE